MPRNGNGREGGDGRGSIPRWVRALFDQHEARMAKMGRTRREEKAEHEERMAEHERRMDELERQTKVQQDELRILKNEEIETRRQTREIVAEIARLDTQRIKEGKALAASLKEVHGRVSRLEGK